MSRIIGVLLAGGQSRRFGEHKAFAKLNEIYLWEYSIEAIKEVTDKQLIISHPDLLQSFQSNSKMQVLTDDDKVIGKGPLAGMYTAMKELKGEWYVFLSCDIPLVTSQVVRKLLVARNQESMAIIPKIKGKIHPLIGVYHHTAFDFIQMQLQNNELKMTSLLKKINTFYLTETDLGVNPAVFSNINSQEDYISLHKNDTI